MRHKRLVKNRKLSWRGFAKKFWDGGSGWLLVFLIGVSSGILAGREVVSLIEVYVVTASSLPICTYSALILRMQYCGHKYYRSMCWFPAVTVSAC